MSRRFRSRRSLRSELGTLAIAAIVPFLLWWTFPSEALRPLPVAPEASAEPVCAFVTLTAAEEHKALASARAAWQMDRSSAQRMNIKLLADSLPPLPPRASLGLSSIPRIDRNASAPYSPDPLPPTLAAPPPAKIVPQPDADTTVPPFSNEELLKLN